MQSTQPPRFGTVLFRAVFRRRSTPLALLPACLIWAASCGPTAQPEPTQQAQTSQAASPIVTPVENPESNVDSDGDGLSDADEKRLGTHPGLDDTDGDGFLDGEELLSLGFDPHINPLRFNPRIADVPRIEVEVLQVPKVYITHTISETESVTVDNSQSVEESTSFASTSGSSQSERAEVSATVGVEVSGTFGVAPSSTVTGNYSVTGSLAQEQSFNWSNTQSRDNRNTLSQSRSLQEGRDVSKSGGRVEVPVRLVNTGPIACSLSRIALGLNKHDVRSGQYLEYGQLEPQTDWKFQDITTLAPGESIEGLVFAMELDLEKAEKLLQPGTMKVRTALLELNDIQGSSFKHRLTAVGGRTTSVLVDYGGAFPTETQFVSTFHPDASGIDLQTLLTDVLGLPVETGTSLWRDAEAVGTTKQCVLRIGDLALDSAQGGYWTVQIETDTGRGIQTQLYHPLRDDLDLASVRVTSNQSVHFLYVIDADRDGLGLRAEASLGLDPGRFDSDGDGIGDGDEVLRGSNPNHGPARAEIVHVAGVEKRLTVEVYAQAEEGGELREVTIDWGDGSPPESFDPQVRFHEHEYATFGQYDITCAARSSASPHAPLLQTTPVRIEPALIESWRLSLGEVSTSAKIAATSDGGLVVLFAQFPPGEKGQGTWHLHRYDRAGQVVWETALEAHVERDVLKMAVGAADRLVVAPQGEIFALVGKTLYAFSSQGEQRYALFPHKESDDSVKVKALAVDSKGRVYVLGSRRPSDGKTFQPQLGFVTRVDAGAAIAWVQETEDLNDTAGQIAVVSQAGTERIVAVTGNRAVLFDELGQRLHAFEHTHQLPTGIVMDPDGALTITGMMYSDIVQADGSKSRQLLGGLWQHDESGQVDWGTVSVSQADGFMPLALDRFGRDTYVAPQLRTQLIDPEKAKSIDNMAGTLHLAGYDRSGRESFGSTVADIRGDALLTYLFFFNAEVLGASDGRSLYLAYPTLDAERFTANRDSVPIETHLLRFELNPRATGMLSASE